MTEMIFIAAALPASMVIYRLLPAVCCRLNKNLTWLRRSPVAEDTLTGLARRLNTRIPLRWRNGLTSRFRQAGFSDRQTTLRLLAIIAAAPLILLVICCSSVLPADRGIIILIGLASLYNSVLANRIKKRRQAFAKALYKMYRFLNLQLTAGIKMTDSLRGLPDAVQDPVIRPVLLRFAARYELTLDFEQSMDEIRQVFGGIDCELLATHLKQCLNTGSAGRSMHRMEDLLFARCFSMMQAETQKIRFRLMLIALAGMLPGAALFLYPMMLQAFSAVQSVFG